MKNIFKYIIIITFLAMIPSMIPNQVQAQAIQSNNLRIYQKVCESYGFINRTLSQEMARCVQLEAHRHQEKQGFYFKYPIPRALDVKQKGESDD